ncbi:helix-turn-helix domain-containing protein [Nonomuraea lactucae]|uniref:helix-turn-helix domain-containing protein n=1 Tax=Nonomuraea lactucae TaxID=2249762 RepID=UPI001F062D2B|nr:helix-turn-helix transcriptional regulator [Nonomuraea lactucae]
MLVGAQLRRLREARGITREDAGYAIRSSHSKISRLELGRTSFKLRDVADLLTLYGVAEEAERQAVLMLARQANAPGWWHDYRDVVPDWFEAYLGLEQDAVLIRTYEVQYVPGLLQTEDYARAVIERGCECDSAEQIERRVAVRMRRQQILAAPTPRKLWAVLDEGALRRQVGRGATMRAQLEHLLQLAELPHITIQVLPFDSPGYAGGVGPVTVLRFAEVELGDVVYLEQIAGAQYLNREADILPYQHLLNQLGVHARPSTATPAFLRRLIAAM